MALDLGEGWVVRDWVARDWVEGLEGWVAGGWEGWGEGWELPQSQ